MKLVIAIYEINIFLHEFRPVLLELRIIFYKIKLSVIFVECKKSIT